MGFLPVGLGALAAYLAYRADSIWLVGFSVASALVSLWSYGVMHNFAMDAARRRRGFRGGFWDITATEADAAPDWVALVNFCAAVACVAALGLVLFL